MRSQKETAIFSRFFLLCNISNSILASPPARSSNMKREAPSDEGVPQDKRRKVISKRYPSLRAPPQRKLMPKAFSTTVMVGSSKFERLPPEIRNTIYDLVLVDKDVPLQVRHKHYFDRGMTTHALTQVSRSVRADCLQMYYSANTFKFHSLLDLEMFLGTAGNDGRFLRKIELDEGVIEVSFAWLSPQKKMFEADFARS